jgi:hypothetical protein
MIRRLMTAALQAFLTPHPVKLHLKGRVRAPLQAPKHHIPPTQGLLVVFLVHARQMLRILNFPIISMPLTRRNSHQQ